MNRKIILTLFILSTSLMAQVGGTYYIRETNQLYSGPYVLYYKNGQKELKVLINDGEEHGLYTRWYDNGQKENEGNYKDGKHDGLWTTWYENGGVGRIPGAKMEVCGAPQGRIMSKMEV